MKPVELIRKARKFRRYFYAVPWCVPPWGWRDASSLLAACACGRVVSGPHPDKFAREVSSFLGVKYAIPVSHARFGIELALRAMGLTRGDEVILPSYLCETALDAVVRSGCTPVFADIGADLHVSPAEVRRAMSPRTKCVIVPHLFGSVAPVDEIDELLRNTGVALIDDAAQSLGAVCRGRKIGTFGTFGLVSIGAGKSLAGPAGGVLLTNDDELYHRAAGISLPSEPPVHVLRRMAAFWMWRRLRRWTWPFYIASERAFHLAEAVEPASRMSNLDGAIGVSQLAHLYRNAEARRRNARAMCEWLGTLAHGHISDFSGMVLRLVMILPETGPSCEDFIEALADAGVEAQMGYRPLHRSSPNARADCPRTDALWQRVLCIPVDTPMPRALPPISLHGSRYH